MKIDPKQIRAASGTTANRPTGVDIGFVYFDTSLQVQVVWGGTSWLPINSVLMQEVVFTTAQLKAAGAVLTATFNVGAALPTNARLLRSEVQVTQGLAATLLTAATASVQGQGDAAASILAGASILGLGFLANQGSNPYCSRGGQQITLTVTLIGAVLNTLTAGSVTVRLFFAICT